jgi:uncharacterized membrane protein YdjX (TVP38/TMEM64 family)
MGPKVRIFADDRSRRSALVLLLVALGLFVAMSILVGRYVPWLTDPRAVRTAVLEFGPLAPAAFFLLQAVQVVVAPVPGHVLGLVSGYLFGTVLGTVISVLGAVVGSYVAFVLSRRFGRPYVESVVDAEALGTFDDVTQDHGLLALFLVFLLPGLPDDVICFTAGLTDLKLRNMVAVSLLGRLPGFYLLNLSGATLEDGDVLLSAVIIGSLGLLTLVVYLRRETVIAWLGGAKGRNPGLSGR